MRNRTIRSVLARRPMFANGGMLPPVTQSPMASGILGSSTPLIETVNNQQSPDRGVRVSMANGGILNRGNPIRTGPRFTAQGHRMSGNVPGNVGPSRYTYTTGRSPILGSASPPPLPTISATEAIAKEIRKVAKALESIIPGLDTTRLSGEEIKELAIQYGVIGGTPEGSEVDASQTGTFMPSLRRPPSRTVDTSTPFVPVEGPPSPKKFAGIGSIFDLGGPRTTAIRPPVPDRVSEIVEETKASPDETQTMLQRISGMINAPFESVTRDLQRKRTYNQFKMPEFRGTPEGSEIDASQVPDAVSALDEYYRTGINPADMTMEEVKAYHADLPDDPEGTVGPKALLGRQIRIDEQKIADAQAQDEAPVVEGEDEAPVVEGEDEFPTAMGNLLEPLNAAPVIGEGPDTSGQADMLATEGIDTRLVSEAPTDLPSLEQISAELQGDETPVVAEDGAEEVTIESGAGPAGGAGATGEVVADARVTAPPEADEKADIVAGDQLPPAAAVVTETFAKQNLPGAPAKTKDQYIQEFKEALPEYKGMSEEEKGFTIMEAGLRVMAGQSANALENIAGGLKGISKEFIADKKARRAYDQQVNMSAAKYGLESVAKDRTAALALAKEGRIRPFELIANKDFVMDGQTIKKGTAVPLTNDQITAGYLTKFPLTYRETFVSDAKAAAELAKKKFEGVQKPQGFSTDRKEYVENARSIKNGVRMKGLLMDAAKIAIPQGSGDSQILGVKPLFSSWVNKALNAAGYQVDTPDGRSKLNTLRSTAPEEYRTLMKTIGTTMVTEILNESNKTISEGDRARVDELVAAYTDYDGTVASYRSLLTKLKNLEKTIDAGINDASTSMRGIEKQWGGVEFYGGARGSDILSTIRSASGTTPSYSVDGRSSVAVPYTDIIDMKTRKFTPKYQNIFNKRKP